MSPKLPHPSFDIARTLRCAGCRTIRHFVAEEPPKAECLKCGSIMPFHNPDLDTIIPLNRQDLVFIDRALTQLYCHNDAIPEGHPAHLIAHRLMREFEDHNPTDRPLGGAPDTEKSFINMITELLGINTTIIELD